MKKIVFLLISVVVTLLVIEGIAWVGFDRPRFFRNMVHDDACGFRMPANASDPRADRFGDFVYRTNSLGFRSPEFPTETRPTDDGGTRFLFCGDSFVNAWAVRERDLMSTRTQALVGEQTGVPTRSFSISGDGLSPSQELILLRRHGSTLRPDAIVLALFPDNDVGTSTPLLGGYQGNYLRPYIVSADDGTRHTTYIHPGRTWFRRHSRAFALLEHALVTGGYWSITRSLPNERRHVRLAQGRPPTPNLDVYDPVAAKTSPWRDAWTAVTELLVDFKREADALDARFLVLVIPSLRQVVLDPTSLIDDTEARGGAKKGLADLLDLNLPERTIGQFCNAHRIDYRLLAGPLRKHAGLGRLRLYSRDLHLTGEGHRHAAEAVAAWWGRRADTQGGDLQSVLRTAPASGLAPTQGAPSEVRLGPGQQHHLGRRWGIMRDLQGLGPGAATGGQIGAIAVPARPGDLVVRGALPGAAKLPFNVGVNIPSLRQAGFSLKKHGSFNVRVPSPLPKRLHPPAYHGSVAVLVTCERPISINGANIGPLIHTVGFEVPRVVPHGQATGCDAVIWAAKRLRPGEPFEIQGTGAPANADGVMIVARGPCLRPVAGRPTIYVNTGAAHASLPMKTDSAGRFYATFKAPVALEKPIVVQALFGDPAAKIGFATSRALIAQPFLGKQR